MLCERGVTFAVLSSSDLSMKKAQREKVIHIQRAWQDSLRRRFLVIAVVIVLLIGITSITGKIPVAHAYGGSSPCSLTTPCTFGVSSSQQLCITSNGSFCVTLIKSDSNGLTFQWSSSLTSQLSPGSLDHYIVFQTLLDANNPSNSVPGTAPELAYDRQGNLITYWTWGPLQANQLYTFQIEGCDRLNNCSVPSTPVAIDTGYFAPTPQTLPNQNCNNQISYVSGPVSGPLPDVTYHLNDCLIQNLNNGYTTVGAIAGIVEILINDSCSKCTTALGIVSTVIQYELNQLAQASTRCNGAGADIEIKLLITQVQGDC